METKSLPTLFQKRRQICVFTHLDFVTLNFDILHNTHANAFYKHDSAMPHVPFREDKNKSCYRSRIHKELVGKAKCYCQSRLQHFLYLPYQCSSCYSSASQALNQQQPNQNITVIPSSDTSLIFPSVLVAVTRLQVTHKYTTTVLDSSH